MIQKNILEQLSILIKLFISNKNVITISIIAFISLVLFGLLNHFNNRKITKIILITMYIVIFGLFIYFYNGELLTLIDYLINNIFILLFFPNLAVYTLVIITANVLMIRSLFKQCSKVYKFISMLFFTLFNIVFYLIIDNIIRNKISVYEQLNIYTNSDLLILIQVSMYLFVIYLFVILISKLAKYFSKPVMVKERVIEKVPALQENIKPIMSDIVEITPNTLIVKDNEIKNIRSANIYNEYIDIEPIKKKKVQITTLSNMDDLFSDKELINNMNIVFGKSNTLSNIIGDIEALKGNVDNQNQIKKIYENISLNSKDLTLKDYNILISALKEVKNSN